MNVRYMDGPRQGDVIGCDDHVSLIEGVFEHGDGTVSAITYRVARGLAPTSDDPHDGEVPAYFVGYGQRWEISTGRGTIPWNAPGDEHFVPPTLLKDATVDELLAELDSRGWQPRIPWLPMRRRRAPMPRAGFGQRWPSE